MVSLIGRLNWLYNQALQRRKTAYEEHEESLGFYDQCQWLTQLRAANEHGLGELAGGPAAACCGGWTTPFRRSFGACGRARLPASPDSAPSAAV